MWNGRLRATVSLGEWMELGATKYVVSEALAGLEQRPLSTSSAYLPLIYRDSVSAGEMPPAARRHRDDACDPRPDHRHSGRSLRCAGLAAHADYSAFSINRKSRKSRWTTTRSLRKRKTMIIIQINAAARLPPRVAYAIKLRPKSVFHHRTGRDSDERSCRGCNRLLRDFHLGNTSMNAGGKVSAAPPHAHAAPPRSPGSST